MVYLFGMNFPLVETLFVLGMALLITMVLIVWALFSLRKLNKKLDEIIKEERIVKHELDLALSEETDQISLLADLMGNVKVIRKIAEKKDKKIKEAETTIAKADKGDKKEAIKHAIDQLHSVDELSKEEENALINIGKDIKKYAKKGIQLPGDIVNSLKGLIPSRNSKKTKKKK